MFAKFCDLKYSVCMVYWTFVVGISTDVKTVTRNLNNTWSDLLFTEQECAT